jgi:hypothetical protein
MEAADAIVWLSSWNMANIYTAVTKQDGGWWIGWIEEVQT